MVAIYCWMQKGFNGADIVSVVDEAIKELFVSEEKSRRVLNGTQICQQQQLL